MNRATSFSIDAKAVSTTETRFLGRQLMAGKAMTPEDLAKRVGVPRFRIWKCFEGSDKTPWLRFEIERVLEHPIWSEPKLFFLFDFISQAMGANVLRVKTAALAEAFRRAFPDVPQSIRTRAEILSAIEAHLSPHFETIVAAATPRANASQALACDRSVFASKS